MSCFKVKHSRSSALWLFLESQENPTNRQKLLRGKEMEAERSLIKSFQHFKITLGSTAGKISLREGDLDSRITVRNQLLQDSLMADTTPLAEGSCPVLWDAPDLLDQLKHPMASSNQD